MEELETQLALQRLVVEKAGIALKRSTIAGADRYQARAAEIDVEMARIRLRALERARADAVIVSPIDGIVVFVASYREGEFVPAFKPVVRVADPQSLVLRYEGGESGRFVAGMRVTATVEGHPIQGHVRSTPSDTGRSEVTFSLSEMPKDVQRGDSAAVEAVLWSKEDVLVVPRQYIHTYKGKPFVNMLVDGLRREQPVSLGAETAVAVEVVEGLRAGDKILR